MNVVLKTIETEHYAWSIWAQHENIPPVEIGVLENIILGDECRFVYTDVFGAQTVLEAADISEAAIEVRNVVNSPTKH